MSTAGSKYENVKMRLMIYVQYTYSMIGCDGTQLSKAHNCCEESKQK